MKRSVMLLGLALASIRGAAALEGLWTPDELAGLAAVSSLQPGDLGPLERAPLAAVLDLGGCSGAFVSEHGLILTSRHCLPLSGLPPEHDPDQAFVAARPAAEVPLPALRAYLTLDLSELPPGARQGRAIERDCEAAGPALRCRVVAGPGGSRRLARQRVFQDLRLVFMPGRGAARLGGVDADGTWPRHAADVALLRAYADEAQRSAPHAAANVPYRPARFLALAGHGPKTGDPVAVLGYPGASYRHRLADEVADARDWHYPERARLLGEILAAMDEVVPARPAARRALAERRSVLANRWRQDQALLTALADSEPESMRRQELAGLRDWLASDQTRSVDYLDDLESLEQAIVVARAGRERALILALIRQEVKLLDLALGLYRHSRARAAQPLPAWRETLQRERVRQQARGASPALDQAVLTTLLDDYAGLPPNRRERALDQVLGLSGSTVDPIQLAPRVAALFQGVTLTDPEQAAAWLEREPGAFQDAPDPLLQLAVALVDGDAREAAARNRERARTRALRQRHLGALQAWRQESGLRVAADGDGGLRVSLGRIEGYRPRDGVRYEAFTTLAGITESARPGVSAIDPGPALMQALERHMAAGGELAHPLDFLSSSDVAPGLSGAPTVNSEGRLVGVVFDANAAGLRGLWSYDGERARAIHVDHRYLRWLLEAVYPAAHLARELRTGSAEGT